MYLVPSGIVTDVNSVFEKAPGPISDKSLGKLIVRNRVYANVSANISVILSGRET